MQKGLLAMLVSSHSFEVNKVKIFAFQFMPLISRLIPGVISKGSLQQCTNSHATQPEILSSRAALWLPKKIAALVNSFDGEFHKFFKSIEIP